MDSCLTICCQHSVKGLTGTAPLDELTFQKLWWQAWPTAGKSSYLEQDEGSSDEARGEYEEAEWLPGHAGHLQPARGPRLGEYSPGSDSSCVTLGFIRAADKHFIYYLLQSQVCFSRCIKNLWMNATVCT